MAAPLRQLGGRASRRAADHEFGFEEQFFRINSHILDLVHEQGDRRLAHRLDGLPDRGQRRVGAVHEGGVVVPDHRDVAGHGKARGRADTSFGLDRRDHSQPVDLDLGTRRARAAALLTMALPGSVYVYQGKELGLWEVEDIPDERRQDPIWHRTGGADPGRDGSRVPLPWAGQEPPFGFSPPGATGQPWLPQPKEWRELTVESETGEPDSMLELYRRALRIRRAEPGLGAAPGMTWLSAPDGVLAFDRGGVACVANLASGPVELPPHTAVLLASGPLPGGLLPPDTAACEMARSMYPSVSLRRTARASARRTVSFPTAAGEWAMNQARRAGAGSYTCGRQSNSPARTPSRKARHSAAVKISIGPRP